MFGQLSWSRLVMIRTAWRCGCSNRCSTGSSGISNRCYSAGTSGSKRCYSAGTSGSNRCYSAGTSGSNRCYSAGTIGSNRCYSAGTSGSNRCYSAGTSGSNRCYSAGTSGSNRCYSAGTSGSNRCYSAGTSGSNRCYSAVASGMDKRCSTNTSGMSRQCQSKEHLIRRRFIHYSQVRKTILSNHIKLYGLLVNINVNDAVSPCLLKSCSMLDITAGRKFYCDVKNDEELKSWLKAIRKDFGNETVHERVVNVEDGSEVSEDVKENPEAMRKLLELSNKLAGVDSEQRGVDVLDSSSSSSDEDTSSSESSSDSDTDDNEDINDTDDVQDRELDRVKAVDTVNISDLSEKQGFTVEEMIDTLKKIKYPADHEEHAEEHEDAETMDMLENGASEFDSDLVTEEICDKTNDTTEFQSSADSIGSEREDVSATSSASTDDKTDWSVVEMEDFGTVAKTEPDGLASTGGSQRDVKTDWSVVEIEDFVNIAEAEPDIEAPWQPPVGLTRGKTGVYDIEDLVAVLRAANAVDIAVMRLPDHVEFADYMVVVSAKSIRQLKAITADVRWIYKQRKSRRDKYVRLEGEGTEWCALDLGNIVLHLFMPRTRELYDLETLWTLGPKFDPKCQEEQDPYVFSVDDLPWLKELEQSQNSNKSEDEVDQSEKQ